MRPVESNLGPDIASHLVREATMDESPDSLFGSPPPTPVRGRSPSPALALPGVSANIINFDLNNAVAQNVGTIALPGSHNFSELSVNPLALSLSYPSPGHVPRPPAPQVDDLRTPVLSSNPTSPSTTVTPQAQRVPHRKPARKRKATPKADAIRPAPPPIHLPDPSDPLPPNLLRNQLGLLGTAGVVGGVRPSQLQTRTQGATASNPIVVGDEPEHPIPRPHTELPPSVRLGMDLTTLPPPTNQEIVSALMEHDDIYRLLENIMKFISRTSSRAISEAPSGSSSAAGSRSQTPSDERPGSRKRRKLRHVPAGADLWDVPFPFNEGEGPATYRANWERERGKKLMAELVTLIKGAARKAAVKSQLQKRRVSDAELASLGKHYRINTLFYPKAPSQTKQEIEVVANASDATHSHSSATLLLDPVQAVAPIASSATSHPTTAFDQLMLSLLSTDQFSLDSTFNSPYGFDSTTPLDSGLYDSWLGIMQTFPVPAEGFAPAVQPSDFTLNSTFTAIANSAETIEASPPSFDVPSYLSGSPPASQNPVSVFDDSLIDPALLPPTNAIYPTPIDTTVNNPDSTCPSLVASPIPSSSSVWTGPMTPDPSEAGWGGDSSVGIFVPGEESAGLLPEGDDQLAISGKEKGKKRDFSDMAGWTDAEKEALSFLEVMSKTKMKGKALSIMNQEGGQDGSVVDEVLSKPPTLPIVDEEFSRLPTLPIVGPVTKAQVLQRAKERREQLVREIEKTRIALWETTIEGGVLAGVVKYYSDN